jgi:hypothetical protein
MRANREKSKKGLFLRNSSICFSSSVEKRIARDLDIYSLCYGCACCITTTHGDVNLFYMVIQCKQYIARTLIKEHRFRIVLSFVFF